MKTLAERNRKQKFITNIYMEEIKKRKIRKERNDKLERGISQEH